MSSYIFNIGLNKAGTSSLAKALKILGIPTAHFKTRVPGEAGGKKWLRVIMQENLRQGRRAFEGVDDTHRAFLDFSGGAHIETIDAQYPGSKFILTWREKESWIQSRIKHELRKLERPSYDGSKIVIAPNDWRGYHDMVMSSVEKVFADRPDDILRLDIPGGDGWEPLCTFLDLPVPDEEFPRLNTAKGKAKQIRKAVADGEA